MKQAKHCVAALCITLMMAPAGFGQNLNARSNREPQLENEGGFVDRLTKNYSPTYVPPIDVSNSGRLDQLIRAGNLYLSLNDAIALALENNIGLEIQRYQFQLTDVGLKLALVGNNGVSFDPVLTGQINRSQNRSINTNTINSGGVLNGVNTTQTKSFALAQGFATGGNATLNFGNTSSEANNFSNAFIPQLNSNFQLQATQPLLNGFGIGLNTRGIRIAKNNQRLADVQFQQNINSTLNTVISAYWNLQAAVLNVDVVRASLAQGQKLLSDDRKQFDIGTMAAIDVTQAEGNVVTAEYNVYTAEGTIRTQEVALKNAISRNGIASASLAAVHIVPITRPIVPDVEPIQPIQDLTETALRNRPEIPVQRINLDNAQINLKATRNAMLPTLNVVGSMNQIATGGVFNPFSYNAQTGAVTPTRLTTSVPGDLIGGYSNILRQLFSVPTISYQIGITFTLNLRNRTA
ncbi:MAG: TolC family protein, partial [Acidobacteriota bacterium]